MHLHLTKGTNNADDFVAFIEEVNDKLNEHPVLKSRKVLIIFDNAPIHTSHKVKERVEELQLKALMLPSYSPEFNPVEYFIGIHKHKVRKHLNKLK